MHGIWLLEMKLPRRMRSVLLVQRVYVDEKVSRLEGRGEMMLFAYRESNFGRLH